MSLAKMVEAAKSFAPNPGVEGAVDGLVARLRSAGHAPARIASELAGRLEKGLKGDWSALEAEFSGTPKAPTVGDPGAHAPTAQDAAQGGRWLAIWYDGNEDKAAIVSHQGAGLPFGAQERLEPLLKGDGPDFQLMAVIEIPQGEPPLVVLQDQKVELQEHVLPDAVEEPHPEPEPVGKPTPPEAQVAGTTVASEGTIAAAGTTVASEGAVAAAGTAGA